MSEIAGLLHAGLLIADVALGVTDLAALRQRLEHAGVGVTMSRSGRPALFCRDPDDNALEFVELG